jgi:roadblock/LC7 domain-containing protein
VNLDEGNGNTLWQDAIRKEINNFRIAFKVLNGEEDIPPTYQEIRCHTIFDVKMEDVRRNARFVAGGHTTDTPHVMTYASTVSRESARIALTLVALNDLDVMMGDIENAYLTAPITEKVWTVIGPEFGDDAGKRALIVRALYGLKSTGAAGITWHPAWTNWGGSPALLTETFG